MREATGQARDRVREQIDQRSTQAGQQVHQHAGDLRDVASQLRAQGKDAPARVADQVAERAERAGSWMKDSDADRILADIEDFARSNPWAVAAGGLALGFVASRVLKASSSRRYEERDTARGSRPRAARRRAGLAYDGGRARGERLAGRGGWPAPTGAVARAAHDPAAAPRPRRGPGRGRTTCAPPRAEAGCERAGRRACASGRSASFSASSRTETSTLIRQEMDLARAELTEKGKEAGKGAGLSAARNRRAPRCRRDHRRDHPAA